MNTFEEKRCINVTVCFRPPGDAGESGGGRRDALSEQRETRDGPAEAERMRIRKKPAAEAGSQSRERLILQEILCGAAFQSMIFTRERGISRKARSMWSALSLLPTKFPSR